MDKLSDIARDYLADFEVLTDARHDFERQLDNWWRILFPKYVKPALAEVVKGEPNVWENQNRPGMCECRVVAYQDVAVRLTDPRASDRGFYTVSLRVGSQPVLKKLTRQETLVKSLDGLALSLQIGGRSPLKWTSTENELASEDIAILPDDPDETAKMVRDAAVRFFRLVVEHHRSLPEKTKE